MTRQPAARRLRLHAACATAAIALLLTACDQPETIAKYETPRVEPRATPVDLDKERSRLDHMLAAIVPAGTKAWFFKLVVPAPAAKEMGLAFDQFLATVKAEPEAQLPEWKLPEGWTQKEGDAMRAATIVIPHGVENYDLTVTTLPLAGDWNAYVKVNVDRWMGQLQQDPLDAATIKKLSRKLPTQAGEATAFELVGVMQRNPMGMPGAMPAGHPPIDGGSAAGSTASTQNQAPPQAGADSGEFAYDLPEGWRVGPASSMRKATFIAATKEGDAEVSVTAFSKFGDMADPRANARRWAGGVGLANQSDDEIAAAITKIEVSGQAGTRFELFSPSDAPNAVGVLAAMTIRGDEVWFFKLSGSKAAVESQRDAFDKFLTSVRFPGSK